MTQIQLSTLLKRLGFSPALAGYRYIREAIKLCLQDPSLLQQQIVKSLYTKVAEACGSTASRVERAMRHAIETAWTRGDVEVQQELFSYSIDANKAKPTNGEFVATLVDYIDMLESGNND